jgi:spore germination protein KC
MMTSGCWNYRELNEISIVSAMGIDRKDDEYVVSVEIVNDRKVSTSSNSSGSAGNESPVVLYEAKGKNIDDALNKILLEAPKELYLGHLEVIVIGDELAKKGIKPAIDFILRDRETRKIFPIIIAKNSKASDVLKIVLPLETITSTNITSSLEELASESGILSNKTFDEVLQCAYIEGCEPTISAVEITGNQNKGENTDNISTSDPKASVKITGSAVLKGYKTLGYFNTDESLAYTILRNKIVEMHLAFPCDDNGNYGSITIGNVVSEKKVTGKGKKVTLKSNISGRGALSEFNCKLDLTKAKNVSKVEKMINKELKKTITDTIKKTQKKYKSDVFGFGETIYRNENKKWQKYKDDWNNTFSKADLKVKTSISIESIGTTITSAKDR